VLVIVKHEQNRHSWIRRQLISPVLRQLGKGGSPRRLAWSLAAGVIIGVNPLIGSATVVTLLVTHLLRLNHPASQIGVHGSYPLQLALFVPFLHAGAVVFGTAPIPLGRNEIFDQMRHHPMELARSLWVWEWHALVVWLGVSAVMLPALAVILSRVLERAVRRHRQRATA
jgi:uncharacterized protein (DUF2062 family)